ncbi:MAG: IS1634 family transposase [Nitrosopumilus sp.]|nr:IS1634 family transposase [Nitrosopumilus sp.]
MASMQRTYVKGNPYWRIVQSKRVNGKPRPIVLAHLGRVENILARWQGTEALKLLSRAHGAVAALYKLADKLDVVGTIDRQLAVTGRHVRRPKPGVRYKPRRNDGLSVGQSLLLAAIGRACHATSKRSFARWAQTTTLGELVSVDLDRLTSQHFWDQMEQLPVEAIAPIERELVQRAIKLFDLPLDTLLYDATNFFTFIASTNDRPKLPARGHNKQKRHDLRQLGVALLCTRQHGIPLWHQLYAGQVPDAKFFPEAIGALRQRLVALEPNLESLTLVYDKGNVSRANQKLVDDAPFHYVASVSAYSQRKLINEANPKMQAVEVDSEEKVLAYRTRKVILGAERTAVVLRSECLLDGQKRGVLQHVASALRWFDRLDQTLNRGKQKRDRARIQRDIETRLMGRQSLSRVMRFQLHDNNGKLSLDYGFDQEAFDDLAKNWLGRLVLITDHDDWSTADIIRAYRGQSHVEAVFAHLKDPVHIALRPQFHWTDQKLHVHVMVCLMGYLLARLLHLQAQRTSGYPHCIERLLEDLGEVRRVTVARRTGNKGRLRLSQQLEDCPPKLESLLENLGVKIAG